MTTSFPSFIKNERNKVLAKRLMLLLITLALSSIVIYITYGLSNRKKVALSKAPKRREFRNHPAPRGLQRREVFRPNESNNDFRPNEGNNNVRQPEPPPEPRDTVQNEPTPPSFQCAVLKSLFLTHLDQFFKVERNRAVLERAFENAKDACLGSTFAPYFSKSYPELAKDKYEECWEEVISMRTHVFQIFADSTFKKCIEARTELDPSFHETKSAEDLLCDYFHSEFSREMQDKTNCARTEEMWEKAWFVCSERSLPEFQSITFLDYFSSQISTRFTSLLASSSGQEATKDELLALLNFWRTLGTGFDSSYYASIISTSSLDAFMRSYRELHEAYQPFKDALDVCVSELIDSDAASPLQMEALENALKNIKPHVTTDKYPIFATEEVQHVHRLVRRTIAKSGSADRALFEHYDDIIRSKVSTNERYKACQAYATLRARFNTMTTEAYGDVENFEFSNDYRIVDFSRSSDRWNIRYYQTHVGDTYRKLLTDGKFHIFQFDLKMRDMLLWVDEKDDHTTAMQIFKNLDYDSKVSGKLQPFGTAFCEYAHARSVYIHKKFTSEYECRAEHERLEGLFRDAREKSERPQNFATTYAMPDMAVTNRVPLICADADSYFDRTLHAYFADTDLKWLMEEAYRKAAEACRPFNTFTRLGIEGTQVPYDEFYAGTSGVFMRRLLQYTADGLKGLSKEERIGAAYTCNLVSYPMTNLIEEVDELIGD